MPAYGHAMPCQPMVMQCQAQHLICLWSCNAMPAYGHAMPCQPTVMPYHASLWSCNARRSTSYAYGHAMPCQPMVMPCHASLWSCNARRSTSYAYGHAMPCQPAGLRDGDTSTWPRDAGWPSRHWYMGGPRHGSRGQHSLKQGLRAASCVLGMAQGAPFFVPTSTPAARARL